MSFSSLLTYVDYVLHRIPWEHWVAMAAVSLIAAMWFGVRNKYPLYGAIALGCAMMMGLFLLDVAVVNRFGVQVERHPEFNFRAEIQRLLHGSEQHRIQIVSNVAVFIPFGFFVSEFLSVAKRINARRCLGIAILCGFILSLSMEVMQRIFRVGMFELTDMAMNAVGTSIGALSSLCLRRLVVCQKDV